MTETELIEEAMKLAKADRNALAFIHHAKYPDESASVRGRYNPARHQLLADLIVDLAERYKGKPDHPERQIPNTPSVPLFVIRSDSSGTRHSEMTLVELYRKVLPDGELEGLARWCWRAQKHNGEGTKVGDSRDIGRDLVTRIR